MVPCVAFALFRLRLEAFTPLVVVWLALGVGYGWCGHALIRDPARAAADVRNFAQASLALGIPLLLMGAIHLVYASPDEHDPCTPSLRVRLAFVSLTIVHGLLLLTAVGSRDIEGRGARDPEGP
jgi:hypothetical protein